MLKRRWTRNLLLRELCVSGRGVCAAAEDGGAKLHEGRGVRHDPDYTGLGG